MSQPTPRDDQAVKDLKTADDLTLDPNNANRGNTRGRKLLDSSLRDFGAGRSILADRTGAIIAGNKTFETARALGLPIRSVQISGDELVVVQRTDLNLTTDERARRLAIADNRIGELDLEWNEEVLLRLQAEGLPLDPFFTTGELERLLGRGLGTGAIDEDTAFEPRQSDIRVGDLFQLGSHRLLCGDATCPAHVTRVLAGTRPTAMLTDPPYGVSYDPAWRHRQDPTQHTAVGAVMNDDRIDWSEAYLLFPGDVVYVWHAGLHAGTVARSLEAAGFGIRSQIIWAKQHFAMGRGHYHWQHEPCWYAVREGRSAHWHGDRSQSTLWEIPNLNPMGGHREGEDEASGHATQKPVRLFEIPILNHTEAGESIFDPFVGSGTAIIAAQKTGRTCLAIERDPRYVQASIDRWERFTGELAVKVAANIQEAANGQ